MKEILSYFMRNPHAADGLEGIVKWRLLDELIRTRIDETQQALAWLVERQYLRKTVAAGTQPIFSLNLDKLEEARDFLARTTADDPQGND